MISSLLGDTWNLTVSGSISESTSSSELYASAGAAGAVGLSKFDAALNVNLLGEPATTVENGILLLLKSKGLPGVEEVEVVEVVGGLLEVVERAGKLEKLSRWLVRIPVLPVGPPTSLAGAGAGAGGTGGDEDISGGAKRAAGRAEVASIGEC